MPHFGLINEEVEKKPDILLQRARLHIRGGKRRLREGKLNHGVVTLFDALVSAMQWYIYTSSMKQIMAPLITDMTNEEVLFFVLKDFDIIDDTYSFEDFKTFKKLVNQALEQSLEEVNHKQLLAKLEIVMKQLEILPFDEKKLPPEDPDTF